MTSSGDVIANDWWIPTSDGHELHIRQKVADPGAKPSAANCHRMYACGNGSRI
jgi:hypothetical protein